MLFDMLVTVKVCKLQHFEIEFKKIDFINVTQFHDNECSITLETLENKQNMDLSKI